MTAPVLIRPIHASCDTEISVVARGMRETLMEVLGQDRGASMYTTAWLEDRVRHHLDPARCTGEVFVAESRTGIVGHSIVRIDEEDDGAPIGLISTTWVAPAIRRQGHAARLLHQAEEWMRDHGMTTSATYTHPDNVALISLYEGHGYRLQPIDHEFVRLSRVLT